LNAINLLYNASQQELGKIVIKRLFLLKKVTIHIFYQPLLFDNLLSFDIIKKPGTLENSRMKED